MNELPRKEYDPRLFRNDILLLETLKYLKDLPYGSKSLVGAGIYDRRKNILYLGCAVNTGNDIWNHAEYMAMVLANKHNINPSQSIVVTTLSPCVVDSIHRGHKSCTEILQRNGFRNIHAGCLDTRQATIEEYQQLGIEISITENPTLKSICQQLNTYFDIDYANRHTEINKQDFITEILSELPDTIEK